MRRTCLFDQHHHLALSSPFANRRWPRTDASDSSPDGSKPNMAHVEAIHTNEQVPGHTNYYEKGGLRTYGDDADHDHEPKMSFARIMSLIAMAFRKSTIDSNQSI